MARGLEGSLISPSSLHPQTESYSQSNPWPPQPQSLQPPHSRVKHVEVAAPKMQPRNENTSLNPTSWRSWSWSWSLATSCALGGCETYAFRHPHGSFCGHHPCLCPCGPQGSDRASSAPSHRRHHASSSDLRPYPCPHLGPWPWHHHDLCPSRAPSRAPCPSPSRLSSSSSHLFPSYAHSPPTLAACALWPLPSQPCAALATLGRKPVPLRACP
mmetsp:Transcript_26825/g.41935  ORF Transcript_26825/g.41935 Transcript_26825/m.41935 type:complete len:214 (-) Transcript_26825:460-1101(-)